MFLVNQCCACAESISLEHAGTAAEGCGESGVTQSSGRNTKGRRFLQLRGAGILEQPNHHCLLANSGLRLQLLRACAGFSSCRGAEGDVPRALATPAAPTAAPKCLPCP